jgi:hypothetical protein
MNSLKLLPEILQELVQTLEDYLNKIFIDRINTLPVKIKNKNQNTILTWNIFPEPQEEILKIFLSLKLIISRILEQPIDGELIYSEIQKGYILDTGIKGFSIICGYTWDLYLYQPEIFIYIRLVHESNLDNTNEWISIDIDLIEGSAWFLD